MDAVAVVQLRLNLMDAVGDSGLLRYMYDLAEPSDLPAVEALAEQMP